jgi:hypothetical protein
MELDEEIRNTVETWKTESSPNKQAAIAVIAIVVGLILAYGFRNFDSSGFTNSLAGFLLGIMLVVIGVAALFSNGKETTTFDPKSRWILIERSTMLGKRQKVILFADIDDARVASIGHRSDGSVSYYVSLHLSDGRRIPLFYPSYYDGRWNRTLMEDRCDRVKDYFMKDRA